MDSGEKKRDPMAKNHPVVRMRGFARYTRLGDALKTVLSRVKPLGSESVPFDRALGRVLAEEVVSKVDVPPFDRSAVDGYAVRAADTYGASELKPSRLRLVGSIEVGEKTGLRAGKRQAVKIATGARMPRGADAVVMLEHTEVERGWVAVSVPLTPGKNVSKRGEDVRAGEVALRKGKLLRPQEIGMLASTGNVRIKVARRPSVSILATGPELRPPGASLGRAQISDTNSYSLAAAVADCGGVPHRLGIVPDDLGALRAALKKAIKHDMSIVSGGSSVGERDVVPEVIAGLGELLFHGVAIRPGGPTAFGLLGGKPVFSLAGFPVATLVAFDLLVRPALRFMQGLPAERGFARVRARLASKISSTLGRVDLVRVRLWEEKDEILAGPLRVTGSGILSSMTRADGFILVPENVEVLKKGAPVEVELYG